MALLDAQQFAYCKKVMALVLLKITLRFCIWNVIYYEKSQRIIGRMDNKSGAGTSAGIGFFVMMVMIPLAEIEVRSAMA